MSYINESLAENERLIYRARFHWLHKAQAWVALAFFLGLGVVGLAVGSGSIALIAAAALSAVGLAIFVTVMMPIWTTEIGVTSQRLISKRGWLKRRTDELQLTSIEEVNLIQSAMGRLFDYGRVVVHGTGVNDIELPTLADPVGLRRALQEAMGDAKAVVTVAEPAVVVPNPAAA